MIFKDIVTNKDIVMHQGEAFLFKYESERKSVTLFGPMRLTRRVFQNTDDTKTYVPLDAAESLLPEGTVKVLVYDGHAKADKIFSHCESM